MIGIREIGKDETEFAGPALLELRPQWETASRLAEFVDTELRPAGYRLIGVFEPGSPTALSVAGFRESRSTAWGHHLYIDDVSTLPPARGRGHADSLLDWLTAEARRLGCTAIHLDSGVGPTRAAAHRLYMRRHLTITAHHFTLDLR
ncbi:GNAT family N-acetyltransferase [Nocardia fluminea]|uniref:Ribosomal protein S18 acetylase RimI-like enzyme n=1 Tax=Nocardia fluminea TaxID=134984 RepID=A0A2N3V7Y7_9NOCA|nr:GNAT family N-acetyltransferase [Nocardia fluminea]PKV77732.1 ribosomal protein S18 acetylase RimI-like enzyme [Nocardia fluminea]